MKEWTENIIVAVIISIIIEMLLPEGNNKKYVKVVSGLYILYVIVNPIFNLVEKDDFASIKNLILNENVVQTVAEEDIRKTYIYSLQDALKIKIEELGYDVDNVMISVSNDYSDISSINVKMKLGSNYDSTKIINLILENYDVDKSAIIIS